MRRRVIPIARLRELLDYDPGTGDFWWRAKPNSRVLVGAQAGSLSPNGYVQIRIDQRLYWAHRLAWAWTFGEQPPNYLDHVNGIGNDNRIINLRPATSAQNQWNRRRCSRNSSGYKGVYWHKQSGRWAASIHINGTNIHLGLFFTPERAHTAYMTAAKKFFGEFARAA